MIRILFLMMLMARKPKRPSRARLRRMFKRQGIGHVVRGIGYRVGNSYRGIVWMRILGFNRADRDVQRVRGPKGPGTGRGVISHWPRPGLHDRLRTRGVPAGALFRDMTLKQALSLESPDGYRVHTIEDDCRALGTGRKIHPVWEPKDPSLDDLEFWQDAVAVAHKYGLRPWGYALPQYWHILPVMKQAGVERVIKLHAR